MYFRNFHNAVFLYALDIWTLRSCSRLVSRTSMRWSVEDGRPIRLWRTSISTPSPLSVIRLMRRSTIISTVFLAADAAIRSHDCAGVHTTSHGSSQELRLYFFERKVHTLVHTSFAKTRWFEEFRILYNLRIPLFDMLYWQSSRQTPKDLV